MTVKCLFGPPDSEACVKIAEEVLGVAKKEFEAKWNLSIVSAAGDAHVPTRESCAALPCSGSKSSESCWAWEEAATLCHQSELTPRVPLLYVPNADNCEPGFIQRHGHLIVAMDADDQVPDFSHDAAAAATAAAFLASLSPRRKGSSPRVTASLYSVHKSAFKLSKTGKNRLVSSSGFGDKDDKLASMKQRCITDYLKVKKVPGQLNAIKTMQ